MKSITLNYHDEDFDFWTEAVKPYTLSQVLTNHLCDTYGRPPKEKGRCPYGIGPLRVAAVQARLMREVPYWLR